MSEEDLKRYVKDDRKVKMITEIANDISIYSDLRFAIDMGFSVSFKDIPFDQMGVFSYVHLENIKNQTRVNNRG